MVEEVRGGNVVKDFVGDEDDVKLDMVLDREQAKVTQNRGELVMRANQQSFDILQFTEKFWGCANENGVAVIVSVCDKSMGECFCSWKWQRRSRQDLGGEENCSAVNC